MSDVIINSDSGVLLMSDLSGSISCNTVSSEDIDLLKKEVDLLKRRTDPDYAQKCAVENLLNQYRKLVLSEEWFEATKKWVHLRLDKIFNRYNIPFSVGLAYAGNFAPHYSERSLIDKSFFDHDIIFTVNGRSLSVKTLLNENPEVEGYEFEKFVVNYCSNTYGNSN